MGVAVKNGDARIVDQAQFTTKAVKANGLYRNRSARRHARSINWCQFIFFWQENELTLLSVPPPCPAGPARAACTQPRYSPVIKGV
jgi:hypothetical protein